MAGEGHHHVEPVTHRLPRTEVTSRCRTSRIRGSTPTSIPCPPGSGRSSSRVRDLVHEADPDVEETIKRTVQPYFVLDGNICAFLAAKDHVNVFLYDPIAPDPEGIVTGGHDNKTGRAIAYREGETINERALLAMFRAIIANNRAGGWRRIQRDGGAAKA